MTTLASKTLKTIEISERVLLLSEGTTEEKMITQYMVTVHDEEHDDATQEPFDSRAEAEAYAAEVAMRPLRPFSVATLLERR